MKSKVRKIGSIILTLAITMTAVVAFTEPGSDRDPLVSVSYVDKKINELKDYVDSKVRNSQQGSSNTSNSPDLKVVELEKGQSIIGESGTEIILRSGEAMAIGSDLGGISDVTAGRDINSSGVISKNHLLIIPRSDGRGVYSKTEAFYMVRGNYTIE